MGVYLYKMLQGYLQHQSFKHRAFDQAAVFDALEWEHTEIS